MSDTGAIPDPDLNQLMQPKSTVEKTTIGPLAAAGAGIAAFIAGAGVVALWPSGEEPPTMAPVSVYSCAEQYTTIAESLSALVAEGVEAGQAANPDVSWINSVTDRREALGSQLEALNAECIDAPR